MTINSCLRSRKPRDPLSPEQSRLVFQALQLDPWQRPQTSRTIPPSQHQQNDLRSVSANPLRIVASQWSPSPPSSSGGPGWPRCSSPSLLGTLAPPAIARWVSGTFSPVRDDDSNSPKRSLRLLRGRDGRGVEGKRGIWRQLELWMVPLTCDRIVTMTSSRRSARKSGSLLSASQPRSPTSASTVSAVPPS